VAEQNGQRACQVLPSWQFIIFPRVCERMSCKESKLIAYICFFSLKKLFKDKDCLY
jgi:hypothetical protein